VSAVLRPTGLNSNRMESPRNATPITTPTKLAWAKIRTATPIAAATNQSDLIGAFFHWLTPLTSVLLFRADPRRDKAHHESDTPPIDTSQLWPVLSFTTVTDSPVSWATQRAAESALA
jgi:hypothetical protein